MLGRLPMADAGELADLWLCALDAEGAAEFIGFSKDASERAAPTIPRYPGQNGSYRCLRSGLIARLKGNRGNAAETAPPHAATRGARKKKTPPERGVKRLI